MGKGSPASAVIQCLYQTFNPRAVNKIDHALTTLVKGCDLLKILGRRKILKFSGTIFKLYDMRMHSGIDLGDGSFQFIHPFFLLNDLVNNLLHFFCLILGNCNQYILVQLDIPLNEMNFLQNLFHTVAHNVYPHILIWWLIRKKLPCFAVTSLQYANMGKKWLPFSLNIFELSSCLPLQTIISQPHPDCLMTFFRIYPQKVLSGNSFVD